MSTVMTLRIHSADSADTEAFGERIGRRLRGGETIELISDLGGGKTTFTRGIVRGTGSHDKVASPTFTVSREYKTPSFIIEHFDFYRLAEAGIMADELSEFIGDPESVIIIEWGEVVRDILPIERLSVQLVLVAEEGREIVCTYPEALAYLLEGEA